MCIFRRIRKYDDKTSEPLELTLAPADEKELVPVFHDECCFHANNQKDWVWLRDDEQLLRQKSRGRLIHVSDFIVEDAGRLVLNEAQIRQQEALPEAERISSYDARKIIYPGKNADPYWDMPQLMEQVSLLWLRSRLSLTLRWPQVHLMIRIFEVTHPGKQMLAIFDQSSAHNAYAKDALIAKRMNVNPGGKQPIMHPGTFPLDHPDPDLRGKPQSMVFPPDHPTHPNQAKGMQAVLEERGLWSKLQAAATGPNPVGRCTACKASEEKRTKARAEAKARLEADPELLGSLGACLTLLQSPTDAISCF